MGSAFKRQDSPFWWVAYYDAAGRRHLVSSKTREEAIAKELLRKIESRVRAEKAAGITTEALTLERYARTLWLPARKTRGVVSVDKDEDCLEHVYKILGRMPLEKIKRQDVRQFMAGIMRGTLAPRTQRAIYSTLRVLFAGAVADELVAATPCTLLERRKELPPKRDKTATWRSGAVYTREEAERLISAGEVPEWRRTLWALLFLTGARVGEVASLKWRDYDAETEPLGRLSIASHWDSKAKRERSATKTGVSREVPVHPTLAKVLAAWKLAGWADYTGRRLTPEDLMVPSPYARRFGDHAGEHLNPNATLRRLKIDCERLGIRPRDQHSMRRTFITLGMIDGCRREILERVTHSGSGGIMGIYTVLPWSALCSEVSKIQLVARGQSASVATLVLR